MGVADHFAILVHLSTMNQHKCHAVLFFSGMKHRMKKREEREVTSPYYTVNLRNVELRERFFFFVCVSVILRFIYYLRESSCVILISHFFSSDSHFDSTNSMAQIYPYYYDVSKYKTCIREQMLCLGLQLSAFFFFF